MTKQTCSLHPFEQILPEEFYYGNMKVRRLSLSKDSRQIRRMADIFKAYVETGIFPAKTRLIGDYLEHTLVKRDRGEEAIAGRYLGIIMPNGSYQYVRLEGESIGVKKLKLQPPKEISILTDTCLFCASNATAALQTGETVSIVAPRTIINSHVKELHISEHMCPYEMDAVTRLTDLIVTLEGGSRAYRKAILAMPTVEYYFYLMDAYNSGFVEKGMMQDWIEQINRHAEKIVNAISRRIPLEIELCQPLQSVEAYILDCVDKGNNAEFGRAQEILSEKSSLWQRVLPITRPRGWRELNYTNYAIAVLESALVKGESERLTIDIENPSEQRILRNAAKIARKLTKTWDEYNFRVIGIYPHEKVFIAAGDECSGSFPRLYYLKQDQTAGECYYREIVESNRRKVI